MAKVNKKFIMYGRPKQKLSVPSCGICKNGNDTGLRSRCWKGITQTGIAHCFTLAAKYGDAIAGEEDVDI